MNSYVEYVYAVVLVDFSYTMNSFYEVFIIVIVDFLFSNSIISGVTCNIKIGVLYLDFSIIGCAHSTKRNGGASKQSGIVLSHGCHCCQSYCIIRHIDIFMHSNLHPCGSALYKLESAVRYF